MFIPTWVIFVVLITAITWCHWASDKIKEIAEQIKEIAEQSAEHEEKLEGVYRRLDDLESPDSEQLDRKDWLLNERGSNL